ncbi:MAG TPA: tRNA lysidine(34) synthetase TilS [Thermoanaerobaculia bacterium]|nr:tRNA lysidine(34) synthetase TilS [Thermoanaerobaculia bacterium]
MSDLTHSIRLFFERFGLQPQHLLVAISGGPDSMALLLVLAGMRSESLSVSAGHVNHRLRGEESDEDEEFVRRFCAELGIQLVVEQGSLNRSLIRPRGIEAAARRLRYEILGRIRESQGADYLVTAHHQNDQAETFLMRALTGSAAALGGVLPVNGTTLRPFLYTPRLEIQQFLAANNRTARQDSSNDDKRFLRNRVRADLLPLAVELNPQAIKAFARSADQVRELLEAVEPMAEEAARRWIVRDLRSSVFDLDHLPSIPWIARTNFLAEVRRLDPASRAMDEGALRRLLGSLEGLTRVSVTKTLMLARQGRFATLRSVGESAAGWPSMTIDPDSTVEIPSIDAEVELSALTTRPDPVSPGQPGTEHFQIRDGRKSTTFTLRPRRIGERFQPLGFTHEKKLKEILINRKIPRECRDTIPLLAVGEEVVWVDKVGVAERFRVGDDPGSWFKISVRYRGNR